MSDVSDAPAPSRRKRLVIGAIAVVAALVVGVIIYALTTGGGSASISPSEANRAVPAFSFHVEHVTPVATVAGQSPKTLMGPAQQAGKQTAAVLDSFYTEAFLDPDNWTAGSYNSAWSVFDPGASQQAQRHAAVLTAGTGAGDTYSDIQPENGVVSAHVLMDPKGQALWVAAKVTFTATGANKDGSTTRFMSTGQYFLEKMGGAWKVVAFDVHRGDKVNQATSASPSGAAPSGSPS